MDRGQFIVFDGVDNSGKTTMPQMIREWLSTEGIDCIATRHPGSTPIGRNLRQILKHSPHPINANAQALLFAADNSMFIDQILKPELKNGTWVLGDRNNFISSMAYQISSGCSMDELDRVHDATSQDIKIDVLFLFSCPWEVTQKRRKQRESYEGKAAPDRYEDAGRAYFDSLSDCYEQVSKDSVRLRKFLNDENNVYKIDASRPLSVVFEEITGILKTVILEHGQIEAKIE